MIERHLRLLKTQLQPLVRRKNGDQIDRMVNTVRVHHRAELTALERLVFYQKRD